MKLKLNKFDFKKVDWSWFITALAVFATWLNTSQNIFCFIIWLGTNAFWCVYNCKRQSYSLSVLFFIYFLLAIRGLILWQ